MERVNFGDKKVNKSNFYKSKKPLQIDDINVNKVLVSKKEPRYGKTRVTNYELRVTSYELKAYKLELKA